MKKNRSPWLVVLVAWGLTSAGCKEPDTNSKTPPVNAAVGTYFLVTQINGAPANADECSTDDILTYSGNLDLDSGGSPPKYIKVSLVQGDDVMAGPVSATKPTALPDERTFRFQGEIKMSVKPGQYWLRCHADLKEVARVKFLVK